MESGQGPAQNLKVIGQRLPRVDARERVTGAARYPADLSLTGMAHAKPLPVPFQSEYQAELWGLEEGFPENSCSGIVTGPVAVEVADPDPAGL